MLTIKEQPNYQDFTQDKPPIHLTAQEFFDLSEPSIHDFAYVTNPDHALDQYAQVTKLIHHATEYDLNLKLS